MIEKLLSWADFKTLCSNYNLSMHLFQEKDGTYEIYTLYDVFLVSCIVVKDGGTECLDFENNFKASANAEIGNNPKRVIPSVGEGGQYSMRPRGFNGVATKNTTTNIDYLVTENIRFIGGTFFSPDAVMGDELDLQIVDVDNVLGFGSGTVLKQYVTSWQVFPGIPNEVRDVDLSDMLPAGLYIRIVYRSHASATVDAHIALNLLSYVDV